MKNKQFYQILYSVWGFIISALVALLALGLVTAALWYFLQERDVWPAWTRVLLLLSVICSFFGVLSLFLRKGLPRKLKQVEPDLPISRKQKLKIVHAFLFLAIFLAWLSTYTYKVIKSRSFIQTPSVMIKELGLSQYEDNLLVTVDVLGRQKGGFVLTVNTLSVEYTKEHLLSMSQNIMLLADKQRFHFIIPFKDLEEKYHAVLANYIPRYTGRMTIEELLKLDVSLKRLAYTPSSDSQEGQDIIHTASGLAEFSFVCDEQACKIAQEDRTPPPEPAGE